MSFVATLRAATAADHERVDALFGAMRLDDRDDYRAMLTAHARVVPTIEAALAQAAAAADLPASTPRTPLLAADLAALGATMPEPLPFVLPDGAQDAAQDGAAWGALYVVEGSRLGGQLLARRVGAGLPHAYLAARHAPGGWRRLLATLEARAATAPQAWRAAVIAGARATFDLFLLAGQGSRTTN